MTRRLLGPVGGPIVFFLVAALVFAGLGWVTYSALGVEQAQREAAARAELGNNLRVALWRLDGRMLPALGVEDSRPYYHYSPPDPAATPLLAANLPDWMKLHFQLDPIDGWCSPQVLDAATADRVRQAWDDVSPRNLLGERSAVLSDLKARYPARDTLDRFAATDRAIPADSLSLAAPILSGDVQTLPVPEPGAILVPPSFTNPAAKPAPPTNQEPKPISNNLIPGVSKDANADVIRLFGWELCPRSDALIRQQDQQQLANNSKKTNDLNYAANQRGNSQAPGTGSARGGGTRMTQKDVDNEKQVADWMNRAGLIDRALREAKQAAEHQMPKGQQPVPPGLNYSQFDGRNSGNTLNPIPGGKIENGTSPPAPGAGGFGPPALPGGPGAAKDDKSKGSKGLTGKDADGGDKTPGSPAAEKEKEWAPAAEQEALKKLRDNETAKQAVEVFGWFASPGEPRLRVTLDRADKDTKVAENTAVPAATPAQPLAIHLGSMRPHWVTAPDGSDMLVLVRAAKIDDKTVYQGVVVDWVKLEAALKEEVKDLFPDAKLVPVKDTSAVFPDRAMTALPVQLDPGPDAPLPPTGWTPLRIGLVLSWVAAIIAFAAVGFAGWSLIDLAERRIRFVSAVTHELRTPLTSLRLYLDMLVSGMIQDEQKRQEYLGTLAIESDRLHRLVDNVLDFARLEKRKKDGDIKSVRIDELAESIRQTWTGRVAQDAKELVVISTLPEAREVKTDPAMIQQIVGNLIDNARKYTREAVDKRIWVWAKPGTGNAVVFEVEDRGPGVPAGERKSIFKPFRRGEQADSKAGGAGLGLALAKSWADVLGAKLTYRPAEGGTGACFRLELTGK